MKPLTSEDVLVELTARYIREHQEQRYLPTFEELAGWLRADMDEDRWLTIKEMAEETGIPESKMRGLVAVMSRRGVLRKALVNGKRRYAGTLRAVR